MLVEELLTHSNGSAGVFTHVLSDFQYQPSTETLDFQSVQNRWEVLRVELDHRLSLYTRIAHINRGVLAHPQRHQ